MAEMGEEMSLEIGEEMCYGGDVRGDELWWRLERRCVMVEMGEEMSYGGDGRGDVLWWR